MHALAGGGMLPSMVNTGPPIRVLIVDDHAVVRAGLRLLLDAEPDIEVVGEAGSAQEAVDKNSSLRPQLVLLDLVLPDENGIKTARRLLEATPALKVLVLSMQDDARYVREAFERKRAERGPLSEREREVLRLLALGYTNQEVARRLYISVRTAETHRAHVMQKLRLQTRAELVRYALEQGLLYEEAVI